MELFEKLPEEKQKTVLNAAYSCFGENGYKKTSIADIAVAARISKASVFQYFGTKKALYLYLFQYACDKIINEMPAGNDDFFECLQIGAEVKVRTSAMYPGMFDYLSSLVKESDEEILSDIHKLNDKQVGLALASLFANVNWEKFKPEINREMAVNIIRWVNEGYQKSITDRSDTDAILQKLWQYMDLLKTTFYKEEYL